MLSNRGDGSSRNLRSHQQISNTNQSVDSSGNNAGKKSTEAISEFKMFNAKS